MIIFKKLLTKNPFTRSGRRLVECRAVILHYVGVPGQRAAVTWSYFEKDCPLKKRHASAHYIVDLDGDIYHAIPDNEVAFHCGTSALDPVSGKIYTDWARMKFGRFVSDPARNSPNNCTIGIELCIDRNGIFTADTQRAAIQLIANLLQEYNLTAEDIGHHKQVVGWKNCPAPWIKEPKLFEEFKEEVRRKLEINKEEREKRRKGV